MVQFNYNGLSKSSGIYVIFNNHNWRIYVGSTKQFFKRWVDGHYKSLQGDRHSNKFLQSDFNKCRQELGHDNFLEFHIIQDMPKSTREERLLVEDKWIKVHFDHGKQCYNLTDRAISREGLELKNSKQTKQKQSEASKKNWQNSEYKKRLLNSETFGMGMLGRTHSEASKKKLREARLKQTFTSEQILARGNATRGKPRSEETKQKISLSRKNNPQCRKVVLIKETELQIFNSIKEASKATGCSEACIGKVCRGQREFAKGLKWQYYV